MAANEYSTSAVLLYQANNIPLYYEMVTKRCPKCKGTFPLYMFYVDKHRVSGIQSTCSICQKVLAKTTTERYARLDRNVILISEKTCYKCKEIKGIGFFSRNKKAKDGFCYKCKECANQDFHQWYDENIEEEQEKRRRWYQDSPENHERKLASYALWYANNPEKGCASSKNWRLNNPEKVLAWYGDNKEHLLELQRIRRLDPLVREKSNVATKAWRKKNPETYKAQKRRHEALKRNALVSDLTRAQWEYIKSLYRYRCVYCGKKPKRLTQDHLIPLFFGGTHSMDNIVPACHSCNSKKGTRPPPVPVQTTMKLAI